MKKISGFITVKPRVIEFKTPRQNGYVLLILLFAVFLMSLGFLIAIPVWQTQIQREMEEELIFRGNQYVEAARVYQMKNPGKFPDNLEILLEEKCIRHLFKDPMTESGEWNVILLMEVGEPRGPRPQPRQRVPPSRRSRISQSRQTPQRTTQQSLIESPPRKVMIAPQEALESISNPQIIGVVSTSTKESMRIYNDQTTYDQWLFFLGMDPNSMPEIIYYESEEEKKEKE